MLCGYCLKFEFLKWVQIDFFLIELSTVLTCSAMLLKNFDFGYNCHGISV